MEQGRILGHHDEGTQNATGVMPALSSRNTSTGFLWHFPVNKVDCIPMYDNALCRLLIFFFPCRLQNLRFGWIVKEEELNGGVGKAASGIDPQLI